MRWSSAWRTWTTRHRVHAGVLVALAYVAFSVPDASRLPVGAALVAAGEALRYWAGGYLLRNEKLTRSGPYRFVRHPLYLGSLGIGLGLALLTRSWWFWTPLFLGLFALFYVPAMRREEAHLRSLFGEDYREYAEEVARLLPRLGAPRPEGTADARFSFRLARANREARTVLAMAALLLVQTLKLLLGRAAAG